MKKGFLLFLGLFMSLVFYMNGENLTIKKIFSGKIVKYSAPSSIAWLNSKKIIYIKTDESSKISSIYTYDLRGFKETLILSGEKLLREYPTKLTPQQIMIAERRREKSKGIISYQLSNDRKRILIPFSGEIFIFNLANKTLDKIYAGDSPAINPEFSPNNKFISYIKNNDLHIYDLSTRKEKRLTKKAGKYIKNGMGEFVAMEEMGRYVSYWWSPNSKYIAYISSDESEVKRYPLPTYFSNKGFPEIYQESYPSAGTHNAKVILKIVNIDDGEITKIFPEQYKEVYLPRVCWARDNLIFYQVQDRRQKTLKLFSYSIDSKKNKLILEEKSDTWVNITGNPVFFKHKDRFFWLSERDGNRHIYLYDFNGKLIKQLTKGDWQVSSISKHYEKRYVLYFYSNKNNPLDNYLYGMDYRKKIMSRITKGSGQHKIIFSRSNRFYIEKITSYKFPYKIYYKKINGKISKLILGSDENLYKKYNLVEPEIIKIKNEGETLYSSLLKPPNFNPSKKYPLIVYIYGGPHSQHVANRWGGDFYLYHQFLAQNGFLVYTLDNRGTFNRGKKFEEYIYRELGKIELKDQLAGVNYLIKQGFVDENRIGIWGGSYGGFMTIYSLINAPSVFKVGVALAPVTDWHFYDTHYTERYLDIPSENKEGYKKSSPLNFADRLKNRLFLIFGLHDDNVHPVHSIDFIKKLEDNNTKFDLLIYPNRAHSLKGIKTRIHLFESIFEFFKKNLNN
jgi:dipeptidyl-peptidase-4